MSDWSELVQQRVRALSKTCPLKTLNSAFRGSNKNTRLVLSNNSRRRLIPPSVGKERQCHHPPVEDCDQSAYRYLKEKSRRTLEFDYEEEAKRTVLEKRKNEVGSTRRRTYSCSCREPRTKRARGRVCCKKKANITRHQIALPFAAMSKGQDDYVMHKKQRVVGIEEQRSNADNTPMTITNVVAQRKKIRKENRDMYDSFLEYRLHLIRMSAEKQRRALRTADVNRHEQRLEYRKTKYQKISSRGETRDDIDLEKRKLKMMENWVIA